MDTGRSEEQTPPSAGPVGAYTPRRMAGLALLLACTLFLFGRPAYQAGWALDDVETIAENPIVTGERPAWQAFAQDYWHHRGDAGLYRPLVTLSLRWNWQWLGPQPGPFHGVNVWLHLAVVAAAAMAIHGWRPGSAWPWAGLALFALHPIQSEAVVWIAGRSSTLCALLGLIPLVLGLRFRMRGHGAVPLAAGLGTVLPMLVKEDGLAFAALWWFLPVGRKRSRRTAVLCGAFSVAVLRYWALGRLGADPSQGVLGHLTLIQRIPLGLGILGEGIGSLFWAPVALGAVDGTERPWQLLGLLACTTLAWGLKKAWGQSKANVDGSDLRLGLLAALAVSLLPCLHVWPGPELFGPRFLYLPLLFLAPWLHLGLGDRLQSPKLALPLAILVSLGLARPVDVQAAGFHSPKAYWSERVRHNPGDARAHNGLGNTWLQEGEAGVSQALTHFRRSIELDPTYSRPHVGLAILARRSMDPAAERLHLEKALGLAPGNPVAWANLGSLHLRRKRPQDAVRAYLKATDLQPGRAAFWRGLARAQWDGGSPGEARVSIRKAMELDPGDPLNAQWQQRIAPD